MTALAKNYHGLLLTRLFLGLTEAPYYPGALYLLSTFYTRKEIVTRISVLYTGNILATAFAGLIAAGVFSGLDKKAGLTGWQWYVLGDRVYFVCADSKIRLFSLQGAVTFVVAVGAVFTLPDELLTTKWLTAEERQLAFDRIARETVGKREKSSTFTGLKEVASDYRVWVFAFMQHMVSRQGSHGGR